MFYKKITALILTIAAAGAGLNAQVFEKSKRFSETFPVNRNTEITVTNKYGNIHLVQWEKDSVRFDVDIRVSSSKISRTDKAFSEIDVKFTTSPYYLIANTTFAGSGKVWSEITDLTKTVINTGNIAEINYTVYLPAYSRITVENRFGNIYTTDHVAQSEFRLSNGNLQANNLKGQSTVVVEFGNANIKQIEQGKVDLNYAELDLKESGKISLMGRSSTIKLGKTDQLQLNSRRDRIQIDEVNSVSGESNFSRVNFGLVHNNLMLSANYGTITVSSMGRNFKTFQMVANYAVNQIYLDGTHFSSVEITYKAKTKITMPPELKISEKRDPAPGADDGFIRAGAGTGLMGEIRMNTTGGEVNFFYRP